MTSSRHPLEDLAFVCLQRMADEGDDALAAVCAQHPARAVPNGLGALSNAGIATVN